MTEPVVIATDLDRTLMFSPSAIKALGGDLPSATAEVLDGRVIGQIAQAVLAQLGSLPSHVHLVPTTTRTVAQLRRIALPIQPRFAIAASGGIVLEDDIPNALWAKTVKERLATSAPTTDVRALLDAAVSKRSIERAYTADDLFCYAIVDPTRFGPAELAAITEQCAPLGWRLARQGRKLYLLPSALNKAKAVRFVVEQIAATTGSVPLLLAAGDSHLDWEMLLLADRGWVPRGSELACSDRRAQHIAITAEPGHRAAASILDEMLDLAS